MVLSNHARYARCHGRKNRDACWHCPQVVRGGGSSSMPWVLAAHSHDAGVGPPTSRSRISWTPRAYVSRTGSHASVRAAAALPTVRLSMLLRILMDTPSRAPPGHGYTPPSTRVQGTRETRLAGVPLLLEPLPHVGECELQVLSESVCPRPKAISQPKRSRKPLSFRDLLVGMTGFEPATPCTPRRSAPNVGSPTRGPGCQR